MFQITPNGKKFEISQEDKLIGIRTSQEDDVKGRQPDKQNEGLTERRHQRNVTLQEDDITKRQKEGLTGS